MTVQDELVSIKVAKLAYKKRFDEECLALYQTILIEGEQNHNYINEKGIYSAPTQSHLQRWLRDIHNIYPIVNVNISQDDKMKFNITVYDMNVLEQKTYSYYLSYENALEIGLYKALKLIEI